MSEYQEFTGKSVEDAIRQAREAFGVAGLDELDFEILTPGSRGVLGMGAEPARILAAPRSALGGSTPKRAAAAAQPLPAASQEGRERGPRPERAGPGEHRDRGPRREGREGHDDRRAPRPGGPGRVATGPGPGAGPAPGDVLGTAGPTEAFAAAAEQAEPQGARAEAPGGPAAEVARTDRPPRHDRGARAERARPDRRTADLTAHEEAQVSAARASNRPVRESSPAVDASPEALAAGKEILEELMKLLGYDVQVSIASGITAKLNVAAQGDDREALGALIGRKGERLSALQHLTNLMLSRRMGAWTRVLVDVEEYRGRRERQLTELAHQAAEHVIETGKMLQLEPMPALERRWIHLALRDHAGVVTQSIGEEPNRRIVVLRVEG
ncbi:MAG TPA: RNA-binding cell elongation regulator Jag/EloR [Candidatus Limnocylindrales bacterium]|nr:RNA-binding cell elongation regulator Jag/EloR [Candidatus Limnocylindrales bacterium]